jgi:hypothetical protein
MFYVEHFHPMPIEFALPEGFQVPDQTEPGQSFDAVATISVGEDGKAQLLALDGLPVEGGEEETEERRAGQPPAAGGAAATAGQAPAAPADNRSFLQAMGAT